MGFVNSWSYLPCEFIIFEGDFYTFLSGFVGRNSCVPGVATKYLPPFVALVLVMLRAAYLLYKYFFSFILVSLKKGLHRKYNGILK